MSILREISVDKKAVETLNKAKQEVGKPFKYEDEDGTERTVTAQHNGRGVRQVDVKPEIPTIFDKK